MQSATYKIQPNAELFPLRRDGTEFNFSVNKETRELFMEWNDLLLAIKSRLELAEIQTYVVVDGVPSGVLANGTTSVKISFVRPADQHDIYLQFKTAGGAIVHETHPILLECQRGRTLASIVGFERQKFAVKLPNYDASAERVANLVARAVQIGFRKLVWTETDSASEATRRAVQTFGADLRVEPELDELGAVCGFHISSPCGNVQEHAAGNEMRLQYDAAFNGHAFYWDNQFVSLAGALFQPRLAANTLDFHYETQAKTGTGAIPREVRHINRLSYHRYLDVKFGEELPNGEFTNPCFTGWVERYLYALSSPEQGERRLRAILNPIYRYAAWVENNRRVYSKQGEFIGYWFSNMGSGADNSPRGGGNQNWRNFPKIGWVDLLAQQSAMYRDIGELQAILGEWAAADDAFEKAQSLIDLLNKKYWNEEKGFYFDLLPENGAYRQDVQTATQASFWAFWCQAANAHQVERFARQELVEGAFGGKFPAASLSSAHPLYNMAGHYWRGGRWPPSAVVLAQGLENCGRPDLAFEITKNFTAGMAEVSDQTVYEFYGLEEREGGVKPIAGRQPNHLTRSDFVGWGKTPLTYSIPRHLVGVRPIPAYRGKDIERWRVHLDKQCHFIKNLSENERKISEHAVLRGYLEWNLFIDPQDGLELRDFCYQGHPVRLLRITRESENRFRAMVDSPKSIQLQVNRFFAAGNRNPSHVPLASSSIFEIGGRHREAMVELKLQNKL